MDDSEFLKALKSYTENSSFNTVLTTMKVVRCKQLSTIQFRDIVKIPDDTPAGQVQFDLAMSKIMKECVLPDELSEEQKNSLNIIDRLIFILEARSETVSPTVTLSNASGDKIIDVNLLEVKKRLLADISANSQTFKDKEFTDSTGNLKITCGVPLLVTEEQTDKVLAEKTKIDPANATQVAEFVSESFAAEILKTLKTVTINGTETVDLSKQTLEFKIQVLDSLPASVVRHVVDYVEEYRNVLDGCLVVQGIEIPVDSSLFSVS